MTLENLTQQIKQKVALAGGLNAKIKLDLGDAGVIYADTTQNPPLVSNEDLEADTTLSCSADVLQAMIEGKQDPNLAFMMGKLKIKGSMGIAMKLSAILED